MSFITDQYRRDKLALTEFVQNFYLGDTLSSRQAQQEVENGVVELLWDGSHLGNGILVTSNGYVATAYHCIEGGRWPCIKTGFGTVGRMVKVCAAYPEYDVALIKAEFYRETAIPMRYRFFDERQLNPREFMPIVTLARWNGCMAYRGGFMRSTFSVTETYEDLTVCTRVARASAPLVRGDSGGVVVSSPGGAIIGIANGCGRQCNATVVRWYEVLNAIVNFSQSL